MQNREWHVVVARDGESGLFYEQNVRRQYLESITSGRSQRRTTVSHVCRGQINITNTTTTRYFPEMEVRTPPGITAAIRRGTVNSGLGAF